MPKYIIEREIPNAGALSAQELQGISQKSCSILSEMGARIQWLESYVTNERFVAFILPLTKQQSKNTLKKEVFQRTVFHK